MPVRPANRRDFDSSIITHDLSVFFQTSNDGSIKEFRQLSDRAGIFDLSRLVFSVYRLLGRQPEKSP